MIEECLRPGCNEDRDGSGKFCLPCFREFMREDQEDVDPESWARANPKGPPTGGAARLDMAAVAALIHADRVRLADELRAERAAREAAERELVESMRREIAVREERDQLSADLENTKRVLATAREARDIMKRDADQLSAEVEQLRGAAQTYMNDAHVAQAEVERLKGELEKVREAAEAQVLELQFKLNHKQPAPPEPPTCDLCRGRKDPDSGPCPGCTYKTTPPEPPRELAELLWRRGAAVDNAVAVAFDDDGVRCELALDASAADAFVMLHNEAIHHAHARALRELPLGLVALAGIARGETWAGEGESSVVARKDERGTVWFKLAGSSDAHMMIPGAFLFIDPKYTWRRVDEKTAHVHEWGSWFDVATENPRRQCKTCTCVQVATWVDASIKGEDK